MPSTCSCEHAQHHHPEPPGQLAGRLPPQRPALARCPTYQVTYNKKGDDAISTGALRGPTEQACPHRTATHTCANDTATHLLKDETHLMRMQSHKQTPARHSKVDTMSTAAVMPAGAGYACTIDGIPTNCARQPPAYSTAGRHDGKLAAADNCKPITPASCTAARLPAQHACAETPTHLMLG